MTSSLDTLARQFRERGHKLTQPRRAILRTLLAASRPLSPAEIQEYGQSYCQDLGLVTVYRTLELLEDLDLVRAVHVAQNCHGYALSTPGHTHHVVCERCHAVVEIVGCELGDFLDSVAERTGYAITGHWLEISGICAECRANERQDSTTL
ncbi:MAG: transcriptional repressor [Anaerolineae bacterium]|jgi:Fur family ferric uptake transcriptional regulator|nr:transcriptional repressor [Anaerolineae bacterium]